MTDVVSDPSTERRSRYGILVLLCGVAGIAYIQRAAISVPAEEVARQLKFANLATDMGWIQSSWYFSYALMQLPAGWFADRIGSRLALAIFTIVWSLATLFSGFASDYYTLIVLWSLMGAAQAGAFPCATKAIGQLFPDAERARASGILACGMAIGGAIAPFLTGLLLEAAIPLATSLQIDRWRLLLACYAIPGLVWTTIFLLLVPGDRLPIARPRSTNTAFVDWAVMLKSRSLALLCAQQFFRAAGMVFFLTWFPTFLQKTRGVSMLTSGAMTTIAGIGAVLGSFHGGFVSDWLLRRTGNSRLSRQGIAVAGMASCSILILASYAVTDAKTSIVLISLGAFCATFGGVSGYTMAINFGGKRVATVFGSMNMCGNLGALFPITAGWLVKQTGNWNLILLLFAAIMAIDAICWAVLNPQGTLFGETDESSDDTSVALSGSDRSM